MQISFKFERMDVINPSLGLFKKNEIFFINLLFFDLKRAILSINEDVRLQFYITSVSFG